MVILNPNRMYMVTVIPAAYIHVCMCTCTCTCKWMYVNNVNCIYVGIYTLRCMIDYIRLNDMGDSVCDLPMSDWEEVPRLSSSEEDKRGPSIDKALWLREMVRQQQNNVYCSCMKTFHGKYSTCICTCTCTVRVFMKRIIIHTSVGKRCNDASVQIVPGLNAFN